MSSKVAHFFIYLVAGAAMGGFLDVVVFDLPTPLYGILGGAVIAILYQIAIAVWLHRLRKP